MIPRVLTIKKLRILYLAKMLSIKSSPTLFVIYEAHKDNEVAYVVSFVQFNSYMVSNIDPYFIIGFVRILDFILHIL